MTRWFVDRSAQTGIPAVSLRRLLSDAQFPGLPDLEVSGCTADARRLEPGEVFVAVPEPGEADPEARIAQALARGAAAVVVEHPCPEAGPLQVIVPDARRAYGQICHALAGAPCRTLDVVAITGVTGKTATAVFLRAILEAAGQRVGVIGPRGTEGLDAPVTPRAADAATLAASLGRIAERGGTTAIVTLSPEAIARHRAEGLELSEVVVTSVRPATLGERPAIAARRAAARLVRRVQPGGTVVLDADDAWTGVLAGTRLDATTVTVSQQDAGATLSARVEPSTLDGTRMQLQTPEATWPLTLRVSGTAAVRAALLAAAVAWRRGIAATAIVAGLEAVRSLPGQLEAIDGLPGGVIGRFDRATTGPELAEALASLRQAGAGRIVCIASAGPDPDAIAALAQAAEAGADQVIATADAALEDLAVTAALDEFLAACHRPGRVRVEPDRRRALAAALELARPGDVILLAGQPTAPPRPATARPRAGLRFDPAGPASSSPHRRPGFREARD